MIKKLIIVLLVAMCGYAIVKVMPRPNKHAMLERDAVWLARYLDVDQQPISQEALNNAVADIWKDQGIQIDHSLWTGTTKQVEMPAGGYVVFFNKQIVSGKVIAIGSTKSVRWVDAEQLLQPQGNVSKENGKGDIQNNRG